jgi:tRNA G18 (ribose-2'-O)-methylase SpoU
MELMSIYSVSNSPAFMEKWKQKGGIVVSTGVDLNRPHTTAQEIKETIKKEDKKSLLLILGSEGKGVSPHLQALSDFTVAIERKGPSEHPFSLVDSLNVAAAASTLLFELTRDR